MTLLEDVLAADDLLNVEELLAAHPWLLERDQKCIISPDADGQLCGLLMSHVLGWEIVGFYDGKAMVCHHNVNPADAVFLDIEIFRPGVKSIGNHMLAFNNNRPPSNWDNFDSCASLNLWRGHHRRAYNRKYPLATIHSLLSVMKGINGLPLEIDAIGPLMFADGVYKVLLNYTENSWDWMRYMGVKDEQSPLHRYLLSPDLAVFQLVSTMLKFWEKRDELSVRGQRGDRISITERSGGQGVINLTEMDNGCGRFVYDLVAKERNEAFLNMLGELTGWSYVANQWRWDDFHLWEFTKETIECTNIATFNAAIERGPISFAITGKNELQIAYPPEDRDPFL